MQGRSRKRKRQSITLPGNIIAGRRAVSTSQSAPSREAPFKPLSEVEFAREMGKRLVMRLRELGRRSKFVPVSPERIWGQAEGEKNSNG